MIAWLKQQFSFRQICSAVSYQLLMFSVLILSMLPHKVHALEQLSFSIEQIKAQDWQLNNLQITLQDIHSPAQKLLSFIGKVTLPEPFSKFELVNIQCANFSWQKQLIVCENGTGKFNSTVLQSPTFEFTFSINEQGSEFVIQHFKLAHGKVTVKAKQTQEDWYIELSSLGVKPQKLLPLASDLKSKLDELSSGRVDMAIKLQGHQFNLNKISMETWVKKLSLQAKQGDIATDSVNLKISLKAKLKQNVWQWQGNARMKQGEVYIAPVYLELKDTSLQAKADGILLHNGTIKVRDATVRHTDIVELTLDHGIMDSELFNLSRGSFTGKVLNPGLFSELYVFPFNQQDAFDGMHFSGEIKGTLFIDQATIKQYAINFDNLRLIDDKKRIAIEQASGHIIWSAEQSFLSPSYINWKQLKIKAIPIDQGQLDFLFKKKKVELLKSADIPALGGLFSIANFSFEKLPDDEPKVYFKGAVKQLSLEQLSNAFGWTSLSGNISGEIPGVEYQNKTLSIDGELKVNAFDGLITIKKLKSSGMFSDFSRFYMDMEIDNLDLYALTQKFEIGAIEGRVSGFMNDLYLENWQPVNFIAWLGTSEDDDSRHRISQKAVENIASIGGGGAADVISKGFLSFFDTFGYDRIGFGCYLNKGVCQLMGVEAAEQGYYIIKGGGIPRIDVIGYNPSVDWDVLIQRLSRISATEKIVVE